AKGITVYKSRLLQKIVAGAGSCLLLAFLLIHIIKDLSSQADAWYFHSTFVWLIVMSVASLIFYWKWKALRKQGIDTEKLFSTLPQE
ncbi:MAG: amino acid transporter, partial [Saprospiraceae bacterium]|nr:amino acid transporter [Saprospiraceae bacterium]